MIMMKNKITPLQLLLGLAFVLISFNAYSLSAPVKVTVYKSPNCGCCSKWVSHLENNGFLVTAHNVKNINAIKQQLGVLPKLASCHTSMVSGYVVEGHVPAYVIADLLRNKPKIKGIAVPRMPIGSPGMEGSNAKPYKVYSFNADGKIEVFHEVDPNNQPKKL